MNQLGGSNVQVKQLQGSNISQIMQILTWHEKRLNFYNDKIVDLQTEIKMLREELSNNNNSNNNNSSGKSSKKQTQQVL